MCKNNGKMNIALFAAAVLLCMTLFTTHLTSGLYARYTTEASGSDSARVAKWKVTADAVVSANIPLNNMAPGSTQNYSFTVINDSEVAIVCIVDVSTTGNLPLAFSVTDSDDISHPLTPGKPVAMTAIPCGKAAKTEYKLTVTWPREHNDAKFAGLLDAVKLYVTAQQVD